MNPRMGLGLALMVCAAAPAAEPAASVPSTAAPVAAGVQATSVAAPAKIAATAKSATPKRLDLRIGDVRNYMMPNEFRAAISAPDADRNTVVVEANRELLPVKYDDPIPAGIVAPFWALAHPLQSWKLLVPDLNRPPDGPPDKVPPPIFRWGP